MATGAHGLKLTARTLGEATLLLLSDHVCPTLSFQSGLPAGRAGGGELLVFLASSLYR